MKIIIATSRPFHLYHLARELAELDHEVTLIGYMPTIKMKSYNLGKAKYISLFWKLLPLSFFALQRINIKLQRESTYKIMPKVDKHISKVAKECDIFIGLSGVVSKSFKILSNKKCITICDRGSSHILSQQEILSANNYLSDLYIENELLGYKTADYIITPSVFAYSTYIKNGIPKNKIFINNYGVNLTRFSHSIKSNKKNTFFKEINALYIGGWSYRKSCDIMFDVLKLNENVTLTHIGTAGDLEIPSHERFRSLGHIPNESLSEYYSSYDVFLLPSREDGFGMVLLEALACGLPVITSKNTGGPDLHNNLTQNECVLIMDEINVESLDKIIKLKKYMNFKNDKTLLSSDDINYYSWNNYAKRYSDFLLKVKKESCGK